MRARRVVVTFETGELAGGEPLTMTAELVLDERGGITGGGVLVGSGFEVPFAASGTHEDVIVPARDRRA